MSILQTIVPVIVTLGVLIYIHRVPPKWIGQKLDWYSYQLFGDDERAGVLEQTVDHAIDKGIDGVFTKLKMSALGEASGDSRAKNAVMGVVMKGIKAANPVANFALSIPGVGEYFEENPEHLKYVPAVLTELGLTPDNLAGMMKGDKKTLISRTHPSGIEVK
jgi:hypothetical protein